MTVKVWSSYSCNNSSSFRLVARFADAASANAVAAELREFFPIHAEEVDARDDYSEEPSEAQRAIATKHDFTWGESLYWGDGGLVGDEPEVFTRDNILIVQHTYCGGLGDLTALIQKLGAVNTDEDDSRTIDVTLLFRATRGTNSELDTELDTLFEQLASRKDHYADVTAPWAEHETYGKASWFRDTGTVGIHLAVDPRDLAALDKWLVDRGIERPSLQIEERDNLARFAAIAKARCTSCGGGVDYLDPRLHDIETPQLVCKPCGGFYELSAFTGS